MSIYWREKPIHKAKEPPCHIECNCDWEEDYTATKLEKPHQYRVIKGQSQKNAANTNIKFLYLSTQHYSSLLIWQIIVKRIWSKYYSISNFILCCPFTDRSRETKESTIPWLSPTRWRETFKLRLILYDSNPCTPMGSEESISQYRFSSFTIKLVIFPKIGWSQNSKKKLNFSFLSLPFI